MKKPSRSSAMLAKCHDCMHFYIDGKEDCENTICPLYPWMPYAKKKPVLEWLKWNHRRMGFVEKKSKSEENV